MKKRNAILKFFLLGTASLGLSACNLNVSIPAATKGDQGPQGSQGQKGEQGDSGETAYDRYIQNHPEYTGDLEQWMDDLVNGRLIDVDDNFVYYWYNNGLYFPYGFIALEYYGTSPELVIPDTFHGRPVFGLCFFTINACGSNLRTITLGANCYEIYCPDSNIAEIRNLENLNFIGYKGLSNTPNLETFDLCALGHHGSEEVTVGEAAFMGSGLKEITVPGFLGEIMKRTFYDTPKLEKVVIQDGLTKIASQAFGCDRLKEMYIPASVTTISANAVYSNYPNTKIYCEAASKPAGWDNSAFTGHGQYEFIWGAEMPE